MQSNDWAFNPDDDKLIGKLKTILRDLDQQRVRARESNLITQETETIKEMEKIFKLMNALRGQAQRADASKRS